MKRNSALGRKAKIVATIGPASEKPEMLEKLIRAGVNVCRLNFSFGTHEEHLEKIRLIRAAAKKVGRHVAILQDLQGPKIRVGILNKPVKVKKNDTLVLTGKTEHKSEFVLPTTYKSIASDCEAGKTILLADGTIILKVVSVDSRKSEVKCSVVAGGTILSGKGINLPYTKISLPAITEKDAADAEFGLQAGVDFIGMSFIRKPSDVNVLRDIFKKVGITVPIIAKIEKPEALDNLEPILDAVDGVMVARGDLAVELSFAKVPAAQKRIIHRANEKAKLTIIATEMLSSMVENPLPTRAEVSDVANGVWDASDCLMLSNESAMGAYPVDAVKAMDSIIRETEHAKGVFRHDMQLVESLDLPKVLTTADAICRSGARLSHELPKAKGIIVVTSSGRTARMVAKYRPATPVFALCGSEKLCSRLAFYYNVFPVLVPSTDGITDELISQIAIENGVAKKGDVMICLRGRNISFKWDLQGLSVITV